MKKSEILTILVNYNGIDDTKECIESLKKSTKETDILVVDNGSIVDESIQILECFPKVNVLRLEKNDGFGKGNNEGIIYAIKNKYNYVMLLNNDTVVSENMIELLYNNYQKNMLLVPIIYYYNDRTQIWYGGGKISRHTGGAYNKEIIKDEENVFCTGCCMFTDLDTFTEVGFFDEDYFMYYEDADLSLRFVRSGCKIRTVKDAKLYHKVSKSTGGNESPFCNYYLTRNRFMFIQKNRDYFFAWAGIITFITRMIRIIQFWVLKKDYKSILRGVLDFFDNKTGRTRY